MTTVPSKKTMPLPSIVATRVPHCCLLTNRVYRNFRSSDAIRNAHHVRHRTCAWNLEIPKISHVFSSCCIRVISKSVRKSLSLGWGEAAVFTGRGRFKTSQRSSRPAQNVRRHILREATAGLEPAHKSFADSRVTPSPRGRISDLTDVLYHGVRWHVML